MSTQLTAQQQPEFSVYLFPYIVYLLSKYLLSSYPVAEGVIHKTSHVVCM